MKNKMTSRFLPALLLLAGISVASARAETTLTVIDGIDLKDWDPAIAYAHETYVLGNVYEPLTRYNTKLGKLEPALATAWSVSQDGLKWTFTLRPNVKFHDGTLVTAGAIKTVLDRNIKMDEGANYLWGKAVVEAPNDSTLVLTTKDPLPLDLVSSSQYTMIYSAAAAAKGTEWFQKGNADGTGPYKVVQWVPNQQVVLEKNPDYWGGWKGGEPDRVIVRIVSEVSTQLQMLRSGEAQLGFSTIPFDLVASLRQDPKLKVDVFDSWQYLLAPIDVAKPPTDNLKFRQALTHIMDYETVAAQLFAGLASVSRSTTPMALPGAMTYDMPKFDLGLAAKLLQESGVPKDKWRISWVVYSGLDVIKNVALLFQANAAKVGVQVDIVQGDWGAVLSKQRQSETAANVLPYRNWPDYGTVQPASMFKTQKKVSFNLGYYSNEQVDTWIDEGTRLEAVDKKGSAEAWRKAYQKVIDDAAAMFIVDILHIVPHSANLQGVTMDPAYETVFFHDLRPTGS